ncbi:MAG: hypothetical protein EOP49_17350 [Sphingobacteriales bacterium]|nr:MAG: hypothetical protein EOP49_17350 [Sphingobacteriales bacterium]
MKNYQKIIILGNLVLVLVLFHRSVYKKETILSKGTLVLMPLAPVDPRSLMQGDYMQLNYDLGVSEFQELKHTRGFCVVSLDGRQVATVRRFQTGEKHLQEGELLVKYFSGESGSVRIGAESYFFQEGTVESYTGARYGGLRVDDEGNSVLQGLYDSTRRKMRALPVKK